MPKGEKKAGGRPKIVKRYSEAVKKNWLKAAAKIAKETGKNVEEHLLRMIIGVPCPLCEGSGIVKNEDNKDILCIGCKGRRMLPTAQDTSIVGIGKLYCDALLIKESEQTINDNRQGPVIGLPPVLAKPKHIDEPEKETEQRLHG